MPALLVDAAIECIGCGVCYSACEVVTWKPDYLGPAALNRAWTLVNDVRDVAQMHLKAVDDPTLAGSRFIASAGSLSFLEMGQILRAAYPDRRIARQGAVVFSGETPVGEVLSGTQSPVLGKPIGTALVAAGHAASATLTVDIRGHRIPLRLSAEPFVK